jgi:hypothetical protein
VQPKLKTMNDIDKIQSGINKNTVDKISLSWPCVIMFQFPAFYMGGTCKHGHSSNLFFSFMVELSKIQNVKKSIYKKYRK